MAGRILSQPGGCLGPPAKAAISSLLFSLKHFNRTGGIRCTCTVPRFLRFLTSHRCSE